MAEDEFDLDDDVDFDEDEESTGASGVLGSKKRTLIIGGVVGSVFLIVAIMVGMRFFREESSSSGIRVEEQGAELVDPAQLAAKKEKKKKIKYEELFKGIEGEDTSRVLKELSFASIRFTTEQNGNKFTILVDRDQETEARNLLAVKGLPSGAVRGYALLDNAQTLGVTEFDKRVRFLRALSGELEKALMQFDVIEDAKVQIVLPEQRLFAVTQPPVTSSILIRKVLGQVISDDLVFSIVELVSNAVENLQQENVSVIDTSGQVLTVGLFERLAAKRAGTFKPKEEDDGIAKSRVEAVGQPIIPDYKSIKQWFDLKWKFEKDLVKKAMKQLMGVLPLGSFKVAITSDLGPIEGGKSIDVRRLTVSVVVDSLNDDIYLDTDTKNQIFSTVSGAIGYVKGRDNIQLSRADFTLLTPEERAEIDLLRREQRMSKLGKLFLVYVLPIGVAFFGVFFGYRYWEKRRKELKSSEVLNEDRASEFDNIKDEIVSDKQIEQIRLVSQSEPEIVAEVMGNWIKSEIEVSGGEGEAFLDDHADELEAEVTEELGDFELDEDTFSEGVFEEDTAEERQEVEAEEEVP